MSRTRYVIIYVWCTVLWCINLQMKINLSTIEAEYIPLIQAMRDIIPFRELMKEISFILDIHIPNSNVFIRSSKRTKFSFPSLTLKNVTEKNIF